MLIVRNQRILITPSVARVPFLYLRWTMQLIRRMLPGLDHGRSCTMREAGSTQAPCLAATILIFFDLRGREPSGRQDLTWQHPDGGLQFPELAKLLAGTSFTLGGSPRHRSPPNR